ncbi:hypothetical protein MUK42_34581 [Musa troglodytarum]|uniref:Uncharacterized protein n=1 Tax=Musa troglodytarum TaxID=320322 RepID=A0A9E7EC48_9LILI|nr:hypothetical protein MUK42_34581 [Musa troglodytarum]
MSSTLQCCYSTKADEIPNPLTPCLSGRVSVRVSRDDRRASVTSHEPNTNPRTARNCPSSLPSSSALLRGDRPTLAGVRPSSKFPVPLQIVWDQSLVSALKVAWLLAPKAACFFLDYLEQKG